MQRVAIFVLTAAVLFESGCPQGPPVKDYSELCRTMNPDHLADPQNTSAPYSIHLNADCYTAGQTVKVTLKGLNNSQTFQGFFLMARKPGVDTFAYGTFDSGNDPEIQTIDCFNHSSNAIGHNNTLKTPMLSKTFDWTAPFNSSDDVGDLEFLATVAESLRIFWVGALQSPIPRCYNSSEFPNMMNANNQTTDNATNQTTDNANNQTTNTVTSQTTDNANNQTTVSASNQTTNTVSSQTTNTVASQTTSDAYHHRISFMSWWIAVSVLFGRRVANLV